MFLNDDGEEQSSQWTYAFTTFLGTAAILAFLGSAFQGVKLNTEPWDGLVKEVKKPAPPPQKAAAAKPQQKKRK